MSGDKRTPKQTLVAHIEEMHGGLRPTNRGGSARLAGHPRPSWNFEQLATWHARKHHRYVTNHYHEGPNTDANNRPPGWRTGEDAVKVDR